MIMIRSQAQEVEPRCDSGLTDADELSIVQFIERVRPTRRKLEYLRRYCQLSLLPRDIDDTNEVPSEGDEALMAELASLGRSLPEKLRTAADAFLQEWAGSTTRFLTINKDLDELISTPLTLEEIAEAMPPGVRRLLWHRASAQIEVDLWRAATVRPRQVPGARLWH
jgi:hypothetical protein